MGRDIVTYIEKNFQTAMEEGHIQVYYQPVIRTISYQACSFEALARWQDPSLGMIYPDEFIPVMEKLKIIHLLDQHILRQVCARLREGLDQGESPLPVSVNLSRLDFTLCDIFSEVEQIVQEYHLPHDMIYFEITESVMAEQKDVMMKIVQRFREADFQIWMDDFGSGYSSLNVLKEYSFNELKLDMIFMRPFHEKAKRIAASVVEMAKDINLHTLVEGVETKEQIDYLREIGCEKAQGFYFGKPQPYEAAMQNLKDRGIDLEKPYDRLYYDKIGQVNVLSSVPFMSREERDAITSARQLNSISLALLEIRMDSFTVLFYNTAFENIIKGTGLFSFLLSEEDLLKPHPLHYMSARLATLLDSTQFEGKGRMNFTSHEDYYEIRAKCVGRTRVKYCVLLQVINLSKASSYYNISHLDQYLRQIYSLFERITLINLRTDSITPLYCATQENLVPGRSNLHALVEEYARHYVYPEDVSDYLALTDPDTMRERFLTEGKTFDTKLLRTAVLHGRYAWKEHTLLPVDEDTFLLTVRSMQDAILDYSERIKPGQESVSPALLWRNLVHSDLLRIFWKDQDRRFLGASKAFLDYYDFASEEVILGKNDEDLGWHVQPDVYMNDELMVIQEGVTTHNIPGKCMNEGENKDILASKAPFYDENGRIAGLMGYFIDRELLVVNDRRGQEPRRRDVLTGLLNTRGISEEASTFRDTYYLRGTDFVRIHISINDFGSYNDQYGFDFGDKIMAAMGKALKKAFSHTCAVGRYAGPKFVVLHQVQSLEEIQSLRREIKDLGTSIRQVDGIPVTLYLSVGYVLFSEFEDLEEQAKETEVRLLADHDQSVSTQKLIANMGDIFRLFDDLPISYCVYHLTREPEERRIVLLYVNRKGQEEMPMILENALGKDIQEVVRDVDPVWKEALYQAAWEGKKRQGILDWDERRFSYSASQIIYAGYCSVTYQEL